MTDDVTAQRTGPELRRAARDRALVATPPAGARGPAPAAHVPSDRRVDNALTNWTDAREGSYIPWAWDVRGTALDLVSGDDGTPTAYGATFRTRFGS